MFTSGEHIWLSAFVYNHSTNSTSKDEEYVFVDLLHPNGDVIVKKTILTQNGTGQGDVFLANTLPSGLYFLQAYTASMQGFEEDNSSKYPILISNVSEGVFSNFDYYKKSNDYTISLALEGGSLISKTFANGALRIMDPLGKVIEPDSVHLSSNKDGFVSKIQVHGGGVGTFALIPQFNTKYSLHVFHSGKRITKPLPPVQSHGVAINMVRDPIKKVIVVKIHDHRIEKQKIENGLNLFIHKDGRINGIAISTSTTSNASQIVIPYDALFQGMNSLSVIDDKKTILAERVFYQAPQRKKKRLDVSYFRLKNDSIQLILDQKSSKIEHQNISVSVLPSETRSEQFRKKAFFGLHLESYFPGPEWKDLWKKEYETKKEINILDKLTLFATPKYDWKNIFNKNLIIPKPPDLTGTIKGKIEDLDQKENPASVLLYSKDNEILTRTEVLDGKFEFKEVSLSNGSKVHLSVIGQNGKPFKSNLSYLIKPSIANFRHNFKTENVHKTDELSEENSDIGVLAGTTQQLKEVTVSAKRLVYQKNFPGFFGVKVDSTIGMTTLSEFILRQGFNPIFISSSFPDPRRAGSSQLAKKNNRCGLVFPSIIIDGVFSSYVDIYENIRMEYIDEIYWDRPDGCSALLVVFTNSKYKNRPVAPRLLTSKEIVVNNGFDQPQPFKRPLYFDITNQTFKHFGILDWKIVWSKGPFNLIVSAHEQKNIRLIIEGLTSSGSIISEDKIISLN